MQTPDVLDRVIDAALPQVPFDGWSEATLARAIRDAGADPALVRSLLPGGAVDLALAYHRRGDARMVAALRDRDLAEMRFRDRIALAVRLRLEGSDREAVRRGSTLFALPQNAARGARAIWGTADAIWDALGDTSEDYNWYSKRAILSGVYGSTVLYWLGDDSPGHKDTWDYLDRRIEDVMRVEKAKARVNANPVLRNLAAGPEWLLSRLRRPGRMGDLDVPGIWPGRGRSAGATSGPGETAPADGSAGDTPPTGETPSSGRRR